MAQAVCQWEGCSELGAFSTRTKPTWCLEHLGSLLNRAGLKAVDDFPGKATAYWLTECLVCGTVAHYRLDYIIEKMDSEKPCRACFWWQWNRSLYSGPPTAVEDIGRVRLGARERGYEYLGPCFSPSMQGDPHRVQCRTCGKIEARSVGNMGGCSCRKSRARRTPPRKPGTSNLFKDSSSEYLSWWDHDLNSKQDWLTTPEKATRKIHWRCPEFGHQFVKSPASMWRCPECLKRRLSEINSERRQYDDLSVADVPEVVVYWADERDPATIPINTFDQFMFTCEAGHMVRRRPMLKKCPVCRGQETKRALLAEAIANPEEPRMSAELAEQFHPNRNGKILMAALSPDSGRMVWWRDPNCGFEWQDTPGARDKRERLRCPRCESILDSLAYHYPDIADEWSPSNPQTAWQVRPTGQTRGYTPEWLCKSGHRWQATTASRTNGSLCPECSVAGKSKIELAYLEALSAIFPSVHSGRLVRSQEFTHARGWRPDIVIEADDGSRSVVVEYDGSYWHAEKSETDTKKSLDLIAADYDVIRLREHPLGSLPVSSDHYLELVAYGLFDDISRIVATIEDWMGKRQK